MAAARPILGLVSLFFLAAGIVLSFFIVLSGAGYGLPETKVFFLEAATQGMGNAKSTSAWTFLSICGYSGGDVVNCGSAHAALAFDPQSNFGSHMNVPKSFIGTNKFYYLSRFAFAFYLVALFFAVCALFSGVLALCTRIGAFIASFFTLCALLFQSLAASVMTAWTLIGRSDFHKAHRAASIGKYAYGFTWAAVACYILATVLFCMGGSASKKSSGSKKSRGRFGSKRSTKSRGSFQDTNESRIKDDYS